MSMLAIKSVVASTSFAGQRHKPHRCRGTSTTTTCFLQQLFQKPNRKGKSELLRAVEGSRFGANHSPQQRAQVIDLVSSLPSPRAVQADALDGKWRLLWTTEEATLGIIRGPLTVTNISQEFDLSGGTVLNKIEFDVLGSTFAASGPLQVVTPVRVSYASHTVTLKAGPLRVSLPSPFGRDGSWTEAKYLDADTRVMQNSRGDTLVLQRMP